METRSYGDSPICMSQNYCGSVFLIPAYDGVAVPLWLVSFSFSFLIFLSSKRKWNEDKIHVSFDILSKFYKWKKSK